jgi:hypothetical protein
MTHVNDLPIDRLRYRKEKLTLGNHAPADVRRL